MKADNILLIGFMGTGKTTVSRALASALGMWEIDTDACIAEREGMSFPAAAGWPCGKKTGKR